jgi:ABC-type dipeptide/oligopeptide/nickel transport system permease subunit
MSVAAPTLRTPAEVTHARRPRARVGTIGGVIVVSFALIAIFAGFIAPYRTTQLAGLPLESPSMHHLLGTNNIGQDVFSQMVSGARVSLAIGLFAGAATVFLGAIVGTFAGWRGGATDAVLMRITDFVMVVPGLPLLIVLAAYAGTSLMAVAAVIALTSWPGPARVLRSQTLSLRNRAHLRAAVGFGGGTLHVLRRHILPEISLLLAASLVGNAGRAVMMEAGLAFLGLGDPLRASWGQVMRDALNFPSLFDTPVWQWWLVPPIVALVLLLLGLTFVGLAIEARLAPRVARHV